MPLLEADPAIARQAQRNVTCAYCHQQGSHQRDAVYQLHHEDVTVSLLSIFRRQKEVPKEG